MPISTRYILNAIAGNVPDLRLQYGTLGLAGQAAAFTGGSGVDCVYATAGMSVDLRAAASGAAVLYLDGVLADYAVSTEAGGVTLRKGADSYRLGLAAGHQFVFTHGHVTALDAARHGASAPLRGPAEQGPAWPAASGAAEAVSSASAGVITAAGMGKLTLWGSAGVEQVCIQSGTRADASWLSARPQIIWFSGQWADYTKTVAGNALTLERHIQRPGDGSVTEHECVTVMGSATPQSDKLVFADGYIHFNEAVAHIQAADLNAAGGSCSTTASLFTPAWVGTTSGAYLPAARA